MDVSLLQRERTVQTQLNAKEMARIEMLGARRMAYRAAGHDVDRVRSFCRIDGFSVIIC